MTEKVIDLLKNGYVVIPKLLLKNYRKLKITEKELLLLIILMDNCDFDPERMAKEVGMSSKEILTLVSGLTQKDIIVLNSVTNNNVCDEYIALDNLYEKLALILMENKEENKSSNIFDTFEKEFARTLSPMEYEIIGAWIEAGFEEETIKLALKEAIYNGVTNLRYIDKILYEWKKKGIKSQKDIANVKKGEQSKNEEVFDYDWLNE